MGKKNKKKKKIREVFLNMNTRPMLNVIKLTPSFRLVPRHVSPHHHQVVKPISWNGYYNTQEGMQTKEKGKEKKMKEPKKEKEKE